MLIHCLFYLNFCFISGGIFDLSDSILPDSLASSTAILNNSSSILPDTRVDLHSLYSDEDFLSTYQAICDQLQYSAFTIFSGVKQDAVVSDVLNKFHVPHLSTEMVSETERKERPFSLFLGPSKEDMTKMVEETVKALTQPGGMVGLISHQSSILLSNTLLSNLQHYKLGVMVEDLTEKDIRPNLVRIRKKEVKTIIVDVAADLVKPFIFQVEGYSSMFHDMSVFITIPGITSWSPAAWGLSSLHSSGKLSAHLTLYCTACCVAGLLPPTQHRACTAHRSQAAGIFIAYCSHRTALAWAGEKLSSFHIYSLFS